VVHVEFALLARERRLRIGMSQQKLAGLIGVGFQQAHQYERGISRISAARLYRIATALEPPIAYFFEDDDDDGSAHDCSRPGGIRANGD
jgi:transcriptional regulator with XRE-family HTH domain